MTKIFLLLTLAFSVPAMVYCQGSEIQSPPGQAEVQSSPTQAQEALQEQSAKGKLTRMDSQMQLLWIETAAGEEMEFSYNGQTKVQGAGGSVEGLASMSGQPLTVHYKSQDDMKLAVLIEVDSDAGSRPSPF